MISDSYLWGLTVPQFPTLWKNNDEKSMPCEPKTSLFGRLALDDKRNIKLLKIVWVVMYDVKESEKRR